MKGFPIFRPGRHTAASGATLDFSEDQLRAAVAAYDPALHEAPIVVGHPKDNHPAYGWVGSISFDEATGELIAQPQQVDPAFSEMVSAGRFKKRSASWYLPDSPNNPKPGTLYLRHVGFLGAQPPAIKGLRDVAFSEDDGVVEFSDYDRYAWGTLASIMRGLREWIIGDKGVEAADKVLPNYLLGDLDEAAKAAREQPPADPVQPAGAMPAFSEEDPMTIAELQAQVAKLTADLATAQANAKPADFAERETALAAREAKIAEAEAKAARATVEARIDAVIKAGRMLPAQRAAAVDFAMRLADNDLVIDFGEAGKTEKLSLREAHLRMLEAAPKVVEFGELSGANGDSTDNIPASLAQAQAAVFAQVANGGKK